jgi:hypothetical protein
MTTSTCWPRIGPATYRATTQEDGLRREAYSQVDEHLMASPQVVELALGTLSRWRHGFEPRWDYAGQGHVQGSRGPVAPHWPRGVHRAVTAKALGPAAREPVDSRLRSSPGHCPLRRQRRCSGAPRETSNRFGPRSRQAGSIPVRLRYGSRANQRVCDEDGSQPVRPEPRPRARITS